MKEQIAAIVRHMERHGYVADRSIATAVHLARELGKPLLVEGEGGVGKTEIAEVMASALGLRSAQARPPRPPAPGS